MSAATIPMTGDVADLIGPVAQHVENRSLLLDKFVFHKNWGLHEIKSNDAHRWSLLRIAENGDSEIAHDARKRKDESERLTKKGSNPEKAAKLRVEANLAESLSKTAKPSIDLGDLRASHTRRFIDLFQTAYGDHASVTIGQLEGRLAINLADSLIQNAGICLDRLFGLPYIPGSAVKGVCRHAALEELKTAKGAEQEILFNHFRAVFGTADNDFSKGDLKPFRHLLGRRSEDQKGAISFLPAYPVNDARIVVDLTNVHYPLYYGGDKKRNVDPGLESSLKEERPQPNPFPTVEVGAQFAFCLVLNTTDSNANLLAAAKRWLETSLTVRGLGAKTAAGYGWFSIRPEVLESLEAAGRRDRDEAEARAKTAAEAEAARKAEEERKASLSPEAAAAESLLSLTEEQFARFAKDLGDKVEIEQRAFIQLLCSNKDKRERWKAWKKKKPEIVQVIEMVRVQLNIPPLP